LFYAHVILVCPFYVFRHVPEKPVDKEKKKKKQLEIISKLVLRTIIHRASHNDFFQMDSIASESDSQSINDDTMFMIQELEEETNTTVDELWVTDGNGGSSNGIDKVGVTEEDVQQQEQQQQEPVDNMDKESLLLIVEEEEDADTKKISTPTSPDKSSTSTSSSVVTKATTSSTAAAVANTSNAAAVVAAAKISSIRESLAFRRMHRSTAAPNENPTDQPVLLSASTPTKSTTDTTPLEKGSSTNSNAATSIRHPTNLFSRFRGVAGGARTSTSAAASNTTTPSVTLNSISTPSTTTATTSAPSPLLTTAFVFTEKEPDAHKKANNWEGWSSAYFGLEVQEPFSTLIYQGKKTIDIRRYDLPKELFMKPIALLETPSDTSTSSTTTAVSSKLPNVISYPDMEQKYHIQIKGWFTIRQCIHYTSYHDFIQDESKHCVGPDSEYGWLQGYTKELYGWVIDSTSQQLQQQQVQFMIRRMRSLFEIGGDILPPVFLTADSTAHTKDEDGKAAFSGQSESPSDEAESMTTTTGEIDHSSSCISKNNTQLISPSPESFNMTNQPFITSVTEETTIETTTEQTVQIESATLTDDIQSSINKNTSESRVSENALVLEKDGNTSMLQSSGENDELNKESSIPSLPASSSDLHLNSSSQEDLVQLLEKANMKIAHLEQSNSALSKKCQEVQIKLVDQKVIMEELQSSFQKRLEQCGELSHDKRNLFSSLEKAMAENKELQKLNATLEEEKKLLSADKLRMSNEISKLKEKMNEDVVSLQSELACFKPKLAELTIEKEALDKEKVKYIERTKKAEEELQKELELNEERKKKMKDYVTAKAEELRTVKDTNAALTRELEETRSQYKISRDQLQDALTAIKLKDTDLRILKTDCERMKADSEMLHRMGNSLEGELSKSAQEVLEHKQKRLEAKQELMSMLKKLEAEQRTCKELKEKIKFSFTPKAISQQKLLNESIESLESALLRLSRRLGKPLPQRTSTKAATDISEEARPILNGSNGGSKDLRGINKVSVNNAATGGKLLEWDTSRLLQILEDETQQVSQSIMMLTSSVDRIYMLLDNPVGERSCVSSFADILSGRQPNGNSIAEDLPVESSRVSGRWPRSLR